MRKKQLKMPEISDIEKELNRVRYRSRYRLVLRSTVYTLTVVAAIAVLIATVCMPVLQIYGASMSPVLEEDDIVVALKNANFEQGDLVAFYIGNKLLVKRMIAMPGQWVNMDEEGNVYVDGALLNEPYLTEKDFGDCDIELPYQVPENRYFVMGDNRATSVDSRRSDIGCIAKEQIVGRIIFRVWPVGKMGKLI